MSPDRHRGIEAYARGETTFAVGLRPQDALALPLWDVLGTLTQRYGDAVAVALSEEAVNPDLPLDRLPPVLRSPHHGDRDPSWMRRTNMVGINVRTVGDYGGVIKYALTLPASHDSIQLLPIWEPGVVESLYGIAGWNLNREFVSDELVAYAPNLDTVERQLRATSNLLHLMGNSVGMDVVPHTDRFSEAAVGSPDLFEWMRISDGSIVDHSEGLAHEAEDAVHAWCADRGTASGAELPGSPRTLFALAETDRLHLLFGDPDDLLGRIDRRVDLIRHLKGLGLEPVPATMGVPFRGIEIDSDPERRVTDDHGLEWPDFVITQPEPMSRVFSPLARYKLYGRVDDNAEWQIDFSRPRTHVWDYVKRHYAEVRRLGNFDFMRGDMSHVQMRPEGVPDVVDEYYDILGAVKTHIQEETGAPWFAYFAESFLPPRDVFQFGEELDHLEASLADATLGDLQSTVVGGAEFLTRFRRYLDDVATRTTTPCFTVMTADKDDPRFDSFYRAGNEVRMFTALFLVDMPSYTGLGFEIRDVHDAPAENERYTKLFVFRERGDSNVYPSKARWGDDYIWGTNTELFERLTALRVFAEPVLAAIDGSTTRWLIPPDATANRGTAAWTQTEEPRYVFVANYDLDDSSGYFGLPSLETDVELVPVFSTLGDDALASTPSANHNGFFHRIEDIGQGEGRVYRVNRRSTATKEGKT